MPLHASGISKLSQILFFPTEIPCLRHLIICASLLSFHAAGAKMKCLRHFKLVKLPFCYRPPAAKIASLRDLTFGSPNKLFHTKQKCQRHEILVAATRQSDQPKRQSRRDVTKRVALPTWIKPHQHRVSTHWSPNHPGLGTRSGKSVEPTALSGRWVAYLVRARGSEHFLPAGFNPLVTQLSRVETRSGKSVEPTALYLS